MKVFNQYIVTESDLDLFHHMNYKKYIEHFEKERAIWFDRIGYSFRQMAADQVGVVIVNLNTSYQKEAREGDTLLIETYPGEIGRSSLSLRQVMKNKEGEVLATSDCLLVMFDLEARKSMRVVPKIARHFD